MGVSHGKTRAACGTRPLGWGSTRALQSVRAWQQVLAITCGPLQAFTTLVQSMVRVFKLEPEPSKAHVLLEIADGICQSISCCYTTLANSNIANRSCVERIEAVNIVATRCGTTAQVFWPLLLGLLFAVTRRCPWTETKAWICRGK